MLGARVRRATRWLKERTFTIQIALVSALSLVLFFTVIHPALVAIHPGFAFGSEALDSRGARNGMVYLIAGTVVAGNIALIAGKMYFEFDDMNILGAIAIFFVVIGLLLPEWLSKRYFKLLPSDNGPKDSVSAEIDTPLRSPGKMLDRETCYMRIRRYRWGSPKERSCIYCGSDSIYEIPDPGDDRHYNRQYNCPECETKFDDTTGTLFAQYDIPIEEQFFICDELQNSTSPSRIAEELGCDIEVVQDYAEDLRACITGEITDLTLTDICGSDTFAVERERINGRYSDNPFPGVE